MAFALKQAWTDYLHWTLVRRFFDPRGGELVQPYLYASTIIDYLKNPPIVQPWYTIYPPSASWYVDRNEIYSFVETARATADLLERLEDRLSDAASVIHSFIALPPIYGKSEIAYVCREKCTSVNAIMDMWTGQFDADFVRHTNRAVLVETQREIYNLPYLYVYLLNTHSAFASIYMEATMVYDHTLLRTVETGVAPSWAYKSPTHALLQHPREVIQTFRNYYKEPSSDMLLALIERETRTAQLLLDLFNRSSNYLPRWR